MDGIGKPINGMPVLDADYEVVVEGETDDQDDAGPKLSPDGTLEISLPDGSVVIDLNPQMERLSQPDGFDENIAEKIDLTELGRICGDLVQAIGADDRSRQQWLEARARGIDLLGLKLDDPKSDIASGAPLEGMSTARDPILLEACIRFMSNASAELLPAGGPVKVRNDGQGNIANDDMAEALQKDMNAYLTTTASDYYPDTKRMLFMTGFGGSGFKKVYHSPLKNRPVSESIDAKDLIVSNAAVDLGSAARVTQVIRMKKSDMVRMQILGVYRDISLSYSQPSTNPVDNKMAMVQGVQPQVERPEDQDYTLYECYCELDIKGYEHKDKSGKPTGLPLPYRVTIDKDSEQILEIRRNWDDEDEEFPQARKTFVEYYYIKGWGFYGIGLLHILGNIAVALTAGMRVTLDSGMLANFPGFLYIMNGATRQMTNHFRVPPGGGAPFQGDPSKPIQQQIMPLPYKEAGPAFQAFLGALRDAGKSVGSIAEAAVGEGTQNAPVGTTLALIEQQTKVEGAVHKGLHASQSEEIRLLKNLFEEDPEALWRHARKTEAKWNEQLLRAALANYDLVPQADPNTSSHMQRLMKAMGIKQLQAANPALYDGKKVDERVMKMMGIDNPEELFAPPPPPGAQPPPDPKLIAKQAELQAKAVENDKDRQLELTLAQMKTQAAQPEQPGQQPTDPKLIIAGINAQVRQAEMAANLTEKEKDRQMKLMVEKLKLASNLAVHPESEPLVQDFLDTPKVPLYPSIDPFLPPQWEKP